MTTTPAVLDLDAGRTERAKARAAAQEGRGDTLPVRLGGEVVAVLASEFPIDVLHPLTELGVDMGLLIRVVMQAMNREDKDEQAAGMQMLVNILGAFPDLPANALAAVQEIAKNLLGETGYAALVAWHPTREDLTALLKGILAWYGVSLGEALQPTGSSPETGGKTSKPISGGTTTDSTPAASSKPRARKASSGRATS